MVAIRPTLYSSWRQVNDDFLYTTSDSEFSIAGEDLPKGREFSTVTTDINIAGCGFGLPESSIFLPHPERRVHLLERRYINQPLWDEALNRLFDRRKLLTGPMSWVFPFYRSGPDTPTGGGCLISLVFVWFRKAWSLEVNSRASEITYRLFGDMYFMQERVRKVADAIELRNFDIETVPINWHLTMASQIKHTLPLYLLQEHGDESMLQIAMADPRTLSNSRLVYLQEYFWKHIVHPETVTWAQRRKYSEKFLEISRLDWVDLEAKHNADLQKWGLLNSSPIKARKTASTSEDILEMSKDHIPSQDGD